MKWACDKCGSCCEVLPKSILGQGCKFYDRGKKVCLIYDNRPKICRVKTGVYGDEFYIKGCKALKEIRNELL